MTERRTLHLLTINTGSSSLKAALYKVRAEEQLEFAVTAERIGRDDSWIRIADARGAPVLDRRGGLPNHEAALRAVFAWLFRRQIDAGLDAVGHRGGPRRSAFHRAATE
jgi:acetate kinase